MENSHGIDKMFDAVNTTISGNAVFHRFIVYDNNTNFHIYIYSIKLLCKSRIVIELINCTTVNLFSIVREGRISDP